MLEIRDMVLADKNEVLAMVNDFYHSDAVDHLVPTAILEQTFEDAVGSEPSLKGVMLCEAGAVVGFAYMTQFYACEVGGKVMMLEEIFMKESCRGKGYGKQFFSWMIAQHPYIKRFRLEVTDSNQNAINLYKGLGFEYLNYAQMILDRD